MKVTFYNNYTDIHNANPDIEFVAEIDGVHLKGDCDIDTPRLVLEYDADILKCNYLRIPKFNRYYFITKTTVSTRNVMILQCESNPLHSFRSGLRETTQLVTRQENKSDFTLIDNQLPLKNSRDIVTYNFNASPFSAQSTSNCVALTVSGGV